MTSRSSITKQLSTVPAARPEPCLPTEGRRSVAVVPQAFHSKLFVDLLLYPLFLHPPWSTASADSDRASADTHLGV